MPSAHIPKDLVAGIDWTEGSDLGVQAAINLGRCVGARVHVVHAAPQAIAELDVSDPAAAAEARAVGAYQALAPRVQALLSVGGPSIDEVLTIRTGSAAKVLIDHATEHGGATIVLGPHEKHALFDFGSTARAILSHHDGGVWVQKGPVGPIRHILVPVDLSEDSLHALTAACSLARELDARVTALFVFHPPLYAYPTSPGYPTSGPTYVIDELRDSARLRFTEAIKAFDAEGAQLDSTFAEGGPSDEILHRSEDADLVILSTHGYTRLAATVLGSVAYSVLKRCKKPVLALRHPEASWQL